MMFSYADHYCGTALDGKPGLRLKPPSDVQDQGSYLERIYARVMQPVHDFVHQGIYLNEATKKLSLYQGKQGLPVVQLGEMVASALEELIECCGLKPQEKANLSQFYLNEIGVTNVLHSFRSMFSSTVIAKKHFDKGSWHTKYMDVRNGKDISARLNHPKCEELVQVFKFFLKEEGYPLD